MVSRRTAALLVGLLLLGGGLWYGPATGTAAPTLTVENQADTPYRVTAYTVESGQRATFLNFAITTRDGERRLATLSQLFWPDGYRNVTLVDRGIPTRRVTVAPGESVTTTVDGWRPGNVTVYLVERLGDDETLRYAELETCTRRGQEHSMTLEGDGKSGSATCTGGQLLP